MIERPYRCFPDPERYCVSCGKRLLRRRWSDGNLEAPKEFAVRQYCDRQCKGHGQRQWTDDERITLRRMRQRQYREANRETLRARARRYNPRHYKEHRDEVREQSREWRRGHPELARLYSKRRYHLIRAGGPLPSERLLSIRYADQGGRCAYCRDEKPLELEHLVPISRGGTNAFDNLLFACRSCNASKGNKHLFTWLARRAGMLT